MVNYQLFVVYLLFGVLLGETSGQCDNDEFPCLNGACVPRRAWCDGEYDCFDGSDESFCHGNCSELHFMCRSGRCIPKIAECDGYDDCGDESDETCHGHNITDDYTSELNVVKAANYLLSRRESDYGWNDFTPRALIALSFAEKYLQIPSKEKVSMAKNLDLQLLLLMKDETESLAKLALHINALYAMCLDPRDFHGIDLIELLRSKTDKAMESDFNLPIVLVTLCLANETKPQDFYRLVEMYDDKRNDRIGVKALTVIAMVACKRHMVLNVAEYHQLYEIESRMMDFIQSINMKDGSFDIYSKALVCQAYNALQKDSSQLKNELVKLQSEDGSFGDLLGTYSVIPALLNKNLADFMCKTRTYQEKSRLSYVASDEIFKPERQIGYSLWIPDGESAGYHTLHLTFAGKKSFYDLMKMAEMRNPVYKFKYDVLKTGKKVYYLAGIPNDAEKELSWMLYRETEVATNKNSTKQFGAAILEKIRVQETDGIDKIFPDDGESFTFQLERIKM